MYAVLFAPPQFSLPVLQLGALGGRHAAPAEHQPVHVLALPRVQRVPRVDARLLRYALHAALHAAPPIAVAAAPLLTTVHGQDVGQEGIEVCEYACILVSMRVFLPPMIINTPGDVLCAYVRSVYLFIRVLVVYSASDISTV